MNKLLHLVLIFNLCFSLREISALSIYKTLRNNNDLELNLLENNKDFENNDYRDIDYDEGEDQRSDYEYSKYIRTGRLPPKPGR